MIQNFFLDKMVAVFIHCEVQYDVNWWIVRLTESCVVAADILSGEFFVLAFGVCDDFFRSAAGINDDGLFECCDKGVDDVVDKLVSNQVADCIVFHPLCQSDVVEA